MIKPFVTAVAVSGLATALVVGAAGSALAQQKTHPRHITAAEQHRRTTETQKECWHPQSGLGFVDQGYGYWGSCDTGSVEMSPSGAYEGR